MGGQTLNPYDLTRSPGGSSGGTAVSVLAGFATIGGGTETGLSIRGPAANTGLVGVVPTRGLVSRTGVIPISFTQDRVGVIARSVVDAALVLSLLRGFDPEDLSTSDGLGQMLTMYDAAVPGDGLKGVRLGIFRDLFRQGDEFAAGNALVDRQLGHLSRQGGALADGLTTGENLIAMIPTLRVNSFEIRAAFNAYLRRRGPSSPVKTLSDFIAGGIYLKGRNLETRFRENLQVESLDTNAEYLRRLAEQRRLRQRLVELMDVHHVDALAYPVKGLPAPPLGTSDSGPRDNPVSSVTGLPAIVLPVDAASDGLPMAMELLGRPFSEARLIQIGRAIEQTSRARVAPKTTPHLKGEVFSY